MTDMWELERLVKIKEKLKNILIDKDVEVDKDDTLSDLVDKVEDIGVDNTINKLISNELLEYKSTKIAYIKSYAFYNVSALQYIDVPNVTTIAGCAFLNSGIKEFTNFQPGLFTGDSVFQNCARNKKIIVPFFKSTTGIQLFRNCPVLKIVDIKLGCSLEDAMFYYCTSLKVLIIRSNALCACTSSNALSNTPIKANTGGYVYVPEILVNDYRTATNWATVANRIIKLEGTIYEDPYWSIRDSTYINIDSVEYELPKSTTVLQFLNTYQVEKMYSNGQVLNADAIIYDYKDTELTTEDIE